MAKVVDLYCRHICGRCTKEITHHRTNCGYARILPDMPDQHPDCTPWYDEQRRYQKDVVFVLGIVLICLAVTLILVTVMH